MVSLAEKTPGSDTSGLDHKLKINFSKISMYLAEVFFALTNVRGLPKYENVKICKWASKSKKYKNL